MTQQEKNRSIIDRAESAESYSEALEVVNACEQLGEAETDDFLFEYVRIGTKNEHLEAAIEDRLFFDEEWLFKVVQYRNMFKIVHEFGLQAVANVESKELVEKAEAHKETGNIEEAKKCLKKALELRPGDGKIEEAINSLYGKRLKLKVFVNGKPTEKYKFQDSKLIITLYENFEIEPVTTIYVQVKKKEYLYAEFEKKQLIVFKDAAASAKSGVTKVIDLDKRRERGSYRGIVSYELVIDSYKGSASLHIDFPYIE